MPANAALDAVLERSARELLASMEESRAGRLALETLCAALLAHVARIEHRETIRDEAMRTGRLEFPGGSVELPGGEP